MCNSHRLLFPGIGISLGAVALLFAASLATISPAAEPPGDTGAASLAGLSPLAGLQSMLKLPVRVVDSEGSPVPGAKVTPWALRSSQGHGFWREDDELAGMGPKAVTSDGDGTAVVMYPRYRDVKERTRTLAVSLHVDHPEFAYVDDLHIDVPLEDETAHQVQLTRGVSLQVRPTIDGRPAALDGLFALWSDGRSWEPDTAPEKTADGILRFPPMAPGSNSLLVVKLEGDRATHFSKLTDLELIAGEPQTIELPLRPAVRIRGALSDDVPRPVRNGRIKVWTLPPMKADYRRVSWYSWAPIQPDGTFAIDGWPADEALQLIALCDGYLATSGPAPAVVENAPDPGKDPFSRPQIFAPDTAAPLTVAMTPLGRCVATVIDPDGEPVVGVNVASWPNVGWWNVGSQIYCHPMVRSEQLLRHRVYDEALDEAFPQPFQAETDAHGKVALELPEGKAGLTVLSDDYELPVFLGVRGVKVELTAAETTEVTLRVQPRGTERLGEWDKLAGVVFGCSTREGRRICALPGVREKMEEFAERFRDAKNQRDPRLLAEAYSSVAEAFQGVGDQAEAAKWRTKAAEQAAKIDAAQP